MGAGIEVWNRAPLRAALGEVDMVPGLIVSALAMLHQHISNPHYKSSRSVPMWPTVGAGRHNLTPMSKPARAPILDRMRIRNTPRRGLLS